MAFANLAAMTDADTARIMETLTKVRNGQPVSQEAFVEWFESPLGYFRPYNGETQQSISGGLSAQVDQDIASGPGFFDSLMQSELAPAMMFGAGAGLLGIGGAGAGTGTAADWWSGMPSGTTEASFGGLGGEVAGADSLVNLASDGLDDAINVDYSGMSNIDNVASNLGTESDWWTGMPAGTVEAAAGGGFGSSPSLWSQVTDFMKDNPWVPRTVGAVLPSLLGAYASNKQTDALQGLADKYAGYGAPYRQRLSDLYANPTSFLQSPEVQVPLGEGMKSAARSLSVQGNPFGSGNAWQQLSDTAANKLFGRLGEEKDRLAGFGGLSAYNQAAPQAATNAINSGGNFYNAIGSGIANVFNPPQTEAQTLASLLKTLKGF